MLIRSLLSMCLQEVWQQQLRPPAASLVTVKDAQIQTVSGMSGLVVTNGHKWSGVGGFTIQDTFVL